MNYKQILGFQVKKEGDKVFTRLSPWNPLSYVTFGVMMIILFLISLVTTVVFGFKQTIRALRDTFTNPFVW